MLYAFTKKIFVFTLCMLCAVVMQAQHASFNASATSGCAPMTVNFTNTSTGANSYSWNLGNGNTSTQTNASASYGSPGTYTVTLTASNGSSNDVTSVTINVYGPPIVNFGASPTSACLGDPISFYDQSTPNAPSITNYAWNFGNGATASGASPSYTYPASGTYNVTLTVTNSGGCVASATHNAFITIHPQPVANFSAVATTICGPPATATFTNTSTGTSPITYLWDFGDGFNSNVSSPTHTYNGSGTYDVSLSITDANGCTDDITKTNYITVRNTTASFSGVSSVCAGVPVTLTNTSTPNITSSSWDFGDGTTGAGSPVTHTYSNGGTYTIKLTTTDAPCTDQTTQSITIYDKPIVTFNMDPDTPCPAPITIQFNTTGNALSYTWDFGDGSGSFAANPSHTYNTDTFYTVKLTGTSTFGCIDSTTKFFTIYPLELSISGDRGGCIPFNDTFTSFAYYGQPLSAIPLPYPYPVVHYAWDFGDGTTSTQATPVHTYTTFGIYTVTLTITTINGCTQTASMIVRAGTPDVPLFTAAPTTICADQTVTFTNHSTGATNYIWDFGDGTNSTAYSPVHLFQYPGTYAVTLDAVNNGCDNLYTLPDSIHVESSKSIFTFSYNCDSPKSVNFYNSSIGADSFTWDFGDGTTNTTTVSPSHAYASAGSYTVRLITHNNTSGCYDTAVHSIQVLTPVASITASASTVCNGNDITYTANLSGGTPFSYQWNVDNFWAYTFDHTYNRTYNTPGVRTAMVIILDSRNCNDTATVNVTIAAPTVSFTATPSVACAPALIQFTDNSTDIGNATITSRSWTFGDGGSLGGNNATPTHTYNIGGNIVATLTVSDNIGCSASSTRTINVHKPNINFTGTPLNACVNSPVSFNNISQGSSLSYSWQFGDGTTSSAFSPTHAYTQAGVYTVKLLATDDIGCLDSSLKTNYVHVYDYPVAAFSLSDTFSICSPLTDTFTNNTTGATSYFWTFGDGNTSVITNPMNTYTQPGLYDIKLLASNDAGCKDSVTHHLEVLGSSGAITYTPLNGCAPLTVNFTANVNNVPNFVYDFADGTTLSTTAHNVTHTYTTPGPRVPQLIMIGDNNCQSASVGNDTIKVDGIYSGFIYSPMPACGVGTINFTDTSHGAFSQLASSHWQFDNGQTSTSSNPSHDYTATGTFPITLISSTVLGCRDTLQSSITVYPKPNVKAGRDTTICLGDTIELLVSGALTYVWSPATALSCTTCAYPSASPSSNTTYIVTGTDDHGCTNEDSVNIGIKIQTSSSVDSGGTICQNGSIQLHAHDSENASYQWVPNYNLSSTTIADPIASPDTTTQYMVIIKEGRCIADTNYTTVVVNTAPAVNAGSDKTIIAGSSVKLETTGDNVNRYLWAPPDGLSCTDCAEPIASPRATTTYKVVVYTDLGCADSAQVTVHVTCDHSQVYMPNTFTPNNDGANDVFYPHGVGLRIIKSFRIYDRWGEKLFERQNIDLNDKQNGWDGTFNGSKLNPDVYVYIIDAICDTGEPITWKGDISLIR